MIKSLFSMIKSLFSILRNNEIVFGLSLNFASAIIYAYLFDPLTKKLPVFLADKFLIVRSTDNVFNIKWSIYIYTGGVFLLSAAIVIGIFLITFWTIIKKYEEVSKISNKILKIQETDGNTFKHLKEFIDRIFNPIQPRTITSILACIAKEHTWGLIDPENLGKNILTTEYIYLLEESLNNDNKQLGDITFFAQDKPSAWGNPNNPAATEMQRNAWMYFDKQKDLKNIHPSIRMRRFLIMSEEEYNADDIELRRIFIEKHAEAEIDLYLVPPKRVREEARRYLRDMAIYLTLDQKDWIIKSNMDDKSPEIIEKVQIIYGDSLKSYYKLSKVLFRQLQKGEFIPLTTTPNNNVDNQLCEDRDIIFKREIYKK